MSRRLNVLLLVLAITAPISPSYAQTNEWAWFGGSNTSAGSMKGAYGAQGTASPANIPGGRTGAISWTDPSGNFWLFGGLGYDSTGNYGYLNDLWEFSTSSSQWTWIGGSNTVPEFLGVTGTYGTMGDFATSNAPGGRTDAASWVDAHGNFWLFGGDGYDSAGILGFLNDLWEFDSSKQQWAWMGGSDTVTSKSGGNGQPGVYGILGTPSTSNIPGGRQGAASWVDSNGNFWLFGGEAYDAGDEQATQGLNDLWRFKPASGEWTWMAGSNALSGTCGCAPATYGSLGVAAPNNTPGGRLWSAAWTDQNGNLWLFGGHGEDSANNVGGLNDLWEYAPSSNEWAWMGGVSTLPAPGKGGVLGVFGTQGVASSSNMPGSRDSAYSWIGQNGHLWLFGGELFGDYGAIGRGSDLWEFDPASSEWTWWGGDGTLGDQSGVYGSLGTPAAGDVPGGRLSGNSWTDSYGNLWLFGGTAVDSTGTVGELNDLWEYQLTIPTTITVIANPNPVTWGQPITFMAKVLDNTGKPVPGGVTFLMGNVAIGGATLDQTGTATWNVAPAVGSSYPLPVGADKILAEYSDNQAGNSYAASSTTITETVNALGVTPAPTFSPAGEVFVLGDTLLVTLNDSNAAATIYYTSDGTAPVVGGLYGVPAGSQVQVTTSETIQAIAIAPGYSASSLASATYTTGPQTAQPTFSLLEGTYNTPQTVSITDSTPGAAIYYTTDGTYPTTASTQYTGPLTVSQSESFQAIAIATGYAASFVATATYTINLNSPPPTFTIAAMLASLTVSPGSETMDTITVTPQNGFNSAVTFTCSGLPSGVTCAMVPDTITPTFGNPAKTTLTIAASASASNPHPARNPFLPAAGLALAGCLVVFTRRRSVRLWLLPLVAIAVFGALSACGGGGSTGGGGGGGGGSTTSTVTVTATSGSIQQTAQITLTVN